MRLLPIVLLRKRVVWAAMALAFMGLFASGVFLKTLRGYKLRMAIQNYVAASFNSFNKDDSNDKIADGLIPDPSFEFTKPKNKFGMVFKYWDGWIYEGDARFKVSPIAHSGKSSCLMIGGSDPKIRMFKSMDRPPKGRYRINAYIRGLDIEEGKWHQDIEFAFNGQYFKLNKNGTFGWTKLTYVVEVPRGKKHIIGPSVGLMATGLLWVDDVTMVSVGKDVPLTPEPVIGDQEAPIQLQGNHTHAFVRCPLCGYKNPVAGKNCYACGTSLTTQRTASGSVKKTLADFEETDPFSGGSVVDEHGTAGTKSLALEEGYVVWNGKLNWSGYDEFAVDVYNDGPTHQSLYVEIRDAKTTDYWTRVNYQTVVPTGASTLRLPLSQLYVGEKSHPGRLVYLDQITRLVFSVGDSPQGTLYFDNLRLSRDVTTKSKQFDGLWAFDLGPESSPLMAGFTRLSPMRTYNQGRGFGFKNVKIWRSFDALQPDPLYQDFICIEKGGLAIDLPNGVYRVFVNLDSPSSYWGEVQRYKKRKVVAEGEIVVDEKQDFEEFTKKYFKFWNTDDRYSDNTFNKYLITRFDEKQFLVTVKDGQLNLNFEGENWALSVSTIIVFPESKLQEGNAFLAYVENQRRFFFDNYFKRVLHKNKGKKVVPSANDKQRGYVLFARNYMEDVFENDTPKHFEIGQPVRGEAFSEDREPLTLSVYPLKKLGQVKFEISDLVGPGVIPKKAISTNFVSNRISRETMDGSVYTIKPRVVIPEISIKMDTHHAVRLWFGVHVPPNTPRGLYRGSIALTPEFGEASSYPVEFTVHEGTLQPVDIAVGPWGHSVNIPWIEGTPETLLWNKSMVEQSLTMLRENGFTTFTGIPQIYYRGFENGKPNFDFKKADEQMALARKLGFKGPIINYTIISNFNMYFRDTNAMRRAGFSNYTKFIKTFFGAIQKHAQANNWLTVYWNLGDEPSGANVARAIKNASAYKKAFPVGPPFFTIASSLTDSGSHSGDEQFKLVSSVSMPNLTLHNAKSVKRLKNANVDWAFYNDGNRWTMGIYMYKAAKQYALKMRLNWHWNNSAGDPYFALDCREDDYAWASATPQGTLITSLEFEREMREGIDDYRHLLTLDRLAWKYKDKKAKQLITKVLSAFELGQTNMAKEMTAKKWTAFRHEIAVEIDRVLSDN